ncbi:nuclear transport factor 2 family protein [Catenuloplanes sp. NPDC051500]|uniref:nuclear transport factor 2 family protein n=1 Tax=Catenuloplanes sp. NPDC051500 TaxID=3363959 RepID=UPI00379B06B6
MSLRSKQEIIELLHACVGAADARDPDAWAGCFTRDGVFRASSGTRVVRKERTWFDDGPPVGVRRHFLSGPVIRVDGDVADSRCAFQIIVTPPDGPSVIATVGEYRDRLRRVDRRWLIEERVLVADGEGAAEAGAGDFAESKLTPMTPSGAGTYKVTVPAGPLWSNVHAQEVGPMIAAAHFGRFTGQWRTMVPGVMSVVEIELEGTPSGDTEFTMDVPAGPIWNHEDAKEKCPAICASYGGRWNGHWTTVVPGRFSVAGCTFTI